MDDADVRLLAALLQEPMAPVSAWARTAGLGDGAARVRLDRLRRHGIYGGMVAVPNSRLFGLEPIVCIYDEPTRPWREVLGMPHVIGASVNHEGVLAPTCLVPPGSGPPAGIVAALGPPDRVFVQADPPLRPAGEALSALQWGVLRASIADPRRPPADIAEELGVATKTVRRHRDALLAGGHMRIEAEIRAVRGGPVLFHMYVQGAGTHPPMTMVHALGGPDRVWVTHVIGRPTGALLFCHAPDIAAAAAMPRRAMRLAGVDHAELVISIEGAYAIERLQAMCVPPA